MNKTKKIIIVGGVWLFIIFIGAVGYRYWFAPRAEKIAEIQAKEQQQDLMNRTSSAKRFANEMNVAMDAFSGYAGLRSRTMQDECEKFNIGLNGIDDGANYTERLRALAAGETDIAVFTIDRLIAASEELNSMPATIVDIIDETKGADGVVGSSTMFPNIDAMNDPDVKIVCMENSPSEFMIRVMMANFNLGNLSERNFVFVDSPQEVVEAYKRSKPSDKMVFVTWEPFISMMISDNYRSIIDTSKLRGYIVDVIVVNRDYLVKNEKLVEGFVKAYRTTMFKHRHDMEMVVFEDAKRLGDPLTEEQNKKLVSGIWWKNTQETFGHFGMTSGHGLQHMEEMIRNITGVLIETKAIANDPTSGSPEKLYYNGIIKRLFETSWHPGFGHEQIRREKALLSLTDAEWSGLQPVGTLQVKILVFARGTSRLSSRSYQTLDDLAEKLKTWPQYYLVVEGNASTDGNMEANKMLAESRARSAVEYLVGKGIDRVRMKAVSGGPTGSTTVSFILGETPY